MRVGVIGCGGVAPAHLDSLGRLAGINVVGVCDIDSGRAEAVARRFAIEGVYSSVGDLIEGARPDVVHVATPPQTHKQLTIEALEAGCHVLVEKPMALDVGEADEMIEAARCSGRALSVCHNYLFSPAVLRARDLLRSGRLGRVLAVDVSWRVWDGKADKYSTTPWLLSLPGGHLHEVAPHVVYLLGEFLGPVTVLAARTVPGVIGRPAPEFHALFGGELGVGRAYVSFSTTPFQIALLIHGTKLTVQADHALNILVERRIEPLDSRGRVFAGAHAGAQFLLGAARVAVASKGRPWSPAHANFLERFYASLRGGLPPPVSAQDGRAVISVLDELWAKLADAADRSESAYAAP